MADRQGSEPPSNPPTRNRGHRHWGGRSSRGRGGRGGRGDREDRGGHPSRPQHAQQIPEGNEALPENTPLSAIPPSAPITPSNQSNRGERGRRATRGSNRSPRRGATENSRRTTLAAPRTFGSNLTTNTQAEESSSGPVNPIGLNIDAPGFTPGQPVARNNNESAYKKQARRNPGRKTSKSTANDLSTRIHEDINNGQYECVICTNEVLTNSNIWSCSICWTVAHLACVKKWYANRAKTSDEQQINWRCPGCNSALTEAPNSYTCWCGKDSTPKSIPGLNPHSCGQSCSKFRSGCLHPCLLLCHAGPCPPCQTMGASQPCRCGRNTSTRRCCDTNYVNPWSCHEICGELLTCGEHECQEECHASTCGKCTTLTFSLCFCGREAKDIPCDKRTDKRPSYDFRQVEEGAPKNNHLSDGWFLGSYKCDSICDRAFDCGKHHCERGCHPQDATAAHCPLSPDMITHCPCGKTPLVDIMSQSRKNCEDLIPSCKQKCNKPLSCGHLCQDTCHLGPCTPCTQRIEISCRCGRAKTKSVCHQGAIETPECMRICHAQLNCGRHEHSERCCPGERKAAERAALRRKSSKHASHANDEVEAEHICTRTCGRPLKCGTHQCEQLCHKGRCSSCPEAIFEEIKCHCGRTVLQPPLPCGTQPPACLFDCTRPRPCGHPQVSHNCHLDEEPCPKCPFLVEKRCVCGKKTLKNQPCWFEEPRCGLPCGRKLKCGAHTCEKSCHRLGECEDVSIPGSRCGQPCGKTRTCGHSDVEQCHAPYPCKEDKPCQAKTFLTCECQRKKQEVRCLATKRNPSPDRGTLTCDDECLRLKRNVLLADALNIDPQTHTDNHVPYSETTLNFYRENPQFAQTYEREYRVFATDPNQKLLRLKPMKSHQRAFLHSLAEDFGFDSQSADPEPHRHVCLFKTPRFVSAPTKTIAQCLKIRPSQQIAPTPQPASSEDSLPVKQPFNALLLSTPQFGLTVEELDAVLKKQYTAYPNIVFHTTFLPDAAIIKGSGSWRPQDLESTMSALKPAISHTITSLGYAQGVYLCHVDNNLNISRNEKDEKESRSTADEGWSAVMRRSARPKPPATPRPIASRNTFIALKKKTPKKVEKQPAKEDVEDDWEEAAEKLGDDE
ncbi:hypothetical protein F4781DRAFT_402932 [Annulohypoxylon bovei var. microspora]|nr:hypothetical protein F4781DRAFT_402932 [Annulohypoxylon bovei var. microspora]